MKKNMKKMGAALLAGALLLPSAIPYSADAAAAIKIYIDGVQLVTRQAPVIQSNTTLVPLRGIFEGLNARVVWNQKAQTITAYKGSNTVMLKIGSKAATINGHAVTLDVPARAINGNTVVPLRFVGEALGQDVKWNSASQSVLITTSNDLQAPSSVTARSLGQYGDGRDLQVSFTKSADESYVDHYRVYAVKSSNASSFNAAKAATSSYTTVLPSGSNQTVSLTAQSKDSDGQALASGQSYQIFVLAVGNTFAPNKTALSASSTAVTLNGTLAATATAVKGTDVGDFGDGRDLNVSFAKAQDESRVSGYKVFVVKTKDAASFNLNNANAVTAQNSTTVNKTGGNPTVALNAQSRDTAGELLRNDVPYTVFVLATSSSNVAANNTLSTASPSITLTTAGSDVSATAVAASDVSDYGDGRDLRVAFNKASNEALVNQYRVLVVKDSKAAAFTVNNANSVASANFTPITKNGSNIAQTLPNTARDTDGDPIRNGTAYRVFVLTIGSGTSSSTNVLSGASQAITLTGNYSVGAASTPTLNDAGDYGDGRDLLVTFGRAADENSLSQYRILVVKAASAANFNLASAINVSTANYTAVPKTGANQSQFLYASTRDVNGEPIRNGVSYRVFVLSVGSTNSANNNANYALSGVSNAVSLTSNSAVSGATNVAATVTGASGNASDIEATFTRSTNEDNVSQYRLLAVPSDRSGSYSLADANATSNYVTVSKAGTGQIRQAFAANSRDVFGNLITTGNKYRIYVLTVAGSGANSLSSGSAEVSLSEASVQAVSSIGVTANTGTVTVNFTPPTNASGISDYRVLLVRAADVANFTTTTASNAQQSFSKSSNGSATFNLSSSDTDIYGNALQAGTPYRAYVLSVSNGTQAASNALSSASNDFTFTN
ncbi:copper amine oxidase N-terminal domain-containing protein [Saccharibacillus sp. JS10]|uniref:copper amine oxidase N-terminal domain-containing protein n=1 Tax=Saccharibacillus sp. JS10 TaxID=2950552 RepID=UPI00210EB9EE|nr:copper amine oxidase N-terminal domain-containing protein [Saccharibacillus sp. JS10]MCQ4087606.1 copper amine oxidase N-terminal domain-containing protein [Saccharibacillus sp. JS10]